MDALEILSDLENVIPYFQPIFSADAHRIIGYEVLGRYKSKDTIMSLGPFFQDEQIPEEYKYDVDLVVVKNALERALHLNDDICIFVNRNAELLMYDHGEPFLQELLSYEKKGFNLNRLVIEISYKNYSGDLDQFDHLIQYYRTYGIQIALPANDKESHDFERIGEIQPDLIKIDLHSLKSTGKGINFHDVLFSLSQLARKIGSTLVFENIEMSYQLQFAWKNGGRYYQGFYLHPPGPEFVERDFLKSRLKEKFHDFISYEKRKLEAVYTTAEFFQAKVQEIVVKNRKSSYLDLFQALIKEMNQIAFRMYVCDENGFQKSVNLFKEKEQWISQPEYISKNWSWRPYFLENIIKMRNDGKGILSDLYGDIETGETIRTFSFPMNEEEYLFIDISYQYLFEHDQLL